MSMSQTLLQQLGGREAIELVVAAFYDRVMKDPALTPFFRNRCTDPSLAAGLADP
jgi:truncated hemoglobin YjbI